MARRRYRELRTLAKRVIAWRRMICETRAPTDEALINFAMSAPNANDIISNHIATEPFIAVIGASDIVHAWRGDFDIAAARY